MTNKQPVTPMTDLIAFAPSGAQIRRTFEFADGGHGISSFELKTDGRFVHDFNDSGCDLGDPETVTLDGKTVYMDGNGLLWPEPALTFKTKSGDTVREGVNMPPLEQPSYELMAKLGFKAAALMSKRPGLGASEWQTACNEQGWDRDSQIIHLEGFIREMGLMPAFAAYAEEAAAEESSMTADFG